MNDRGAGADLPGSAPRPTAHSIASPIEPADVQAWIDCRLAADRVDAMMAWFAHNPAAAANAQRDRELCQALRTRLGPTLEPVVPHQLRVASILARRRTRRYGVLLRVAASIALLAAGAGGGWLARAAMDPSGLSLAAIGMGPPPVTADALAAHRMFVSEPRHPVEVGAGEEEHLVRWLSNRLHRPLPAPNLTAQGFQLMGGRLLPGTRTGPAAQLMYQGADGTRLTVYLRATDDDGTTEFRFAGEGEVNAFWWTDRGFAYAITAPVDRDRLRTVAQAVFDALDDAKR